MTNTKALQNGKKLILGEVDRIGECAFADCYLLDSIVIPDSVTSIGDGAFHGCGKLKSMIIPNGVTSIGDYAFDDCYDLENITFNGTTAEWNAIEKDSSWNYNVPATEVICTDGVVTIE